MLIAQITDTHITRPDPDTPRSLERVKALETFVAHVQGMAEKPDLVLHTGDVTHGGTPEDYDTVRAALEPIGVPVHFSLGNRDDGSNLVEGLAALGGMALVDDFLIYGIEGHPVRLIAMDTRHRKSNIGTTCSVRLCILEELLDERPDTPTALFMHHPPFEVPTSKYPFQFDDQVLADAFLNLVAGKKQIVHLFCGHMHRHFGVDLKTCRASVAPSLPPDNRLGDFEADLKDRPLFQLHRWNAERNRFETSLHAAGALS